YRQGTETSPNQGVSRTDASIGALQALCRFVQRGRCCFPPVVVQGPDLRWPPLLTKPPGGGTWNGTQRKPRPLLGVRGHGTKLSAAYVRPEFLRGHCPGAP